MHQERTAGAFHLSTDPARLQLDVIHQYLTRSYWAQGITRQRVERSVAHSLNFAAYHDGSQIGFARLITDSSTFGYLCDVFVLESWRNQGVARLLLEEITHHPDVAELRRLMLVTRDAHGVYAKFGFVSPARPEGLMELVRPKIYRNAPADLE